MFRVFGLAVGSLLIPVGSTIACDDPEGFSVFWVSDQLTWGASFAGS